MGDITQLQDYILYQIGQYIPTPDILSLILCSKFFLKHFDSHHIWRERSKDKSPSPRQSRSNSKRIKQVNKSSVTYVEIKRLYILSWKSYIAHKRKDALHRFELDYHSRFRLDLRKEVGTTIRKAIYGKILSGNDAQAQCVHSRVLFYFTKKIHSEEWDECSTVLHTMCSNCSCQCQGSVWFCLCCEKYICQKCSDGNLVKPGHVHHPFIKLQLSPLSASFHSAYTCGCFDCGITVQVRAKCSTSIATVGSSHNYVHELNRSARSMSWSVSSTDSSLAQSLSTLSLSSPPPPPPSQPLPLLSTLSPLSPRCSLAAVEFISAGVDGLFRQKCRTQSGQLELLSRLRQHVDFLVEA